MRTWMIGAWAVAALLRLSGPAAAEEAGPPAGRLRLDAEALWWSISDAPQPTPLATSGTLADLPFPGALGQPGTRIAIGGGSVNLPAAPGARFAVGGILDAATGFGVEAAGFFLTTALDRDQVATDGLPGSPSFAVPLFDASGYTSGGSPGETLYVLPTPFPDGPGFAGRMERSLSSRLYGAELSGSLPVHRSGGFSVEAMAGYRWLVLSENLTFDVRTAGVAGSSSQGQFFNSRDEFGTRNTFNGAQLGGRARVDMDRFVGVATVKGALGDMHSRLSIDGSSSTSAGTIFYPVRGGAGNQLGGGIFAQPSNIGTHESHRLAGVVEAGVRVGYRVTDWLTPYVAYNALFVGSVLRPGDAVDRSINTTATPLAAASRASGFPNPTGGPAAPSASPKTSSVWAQGFSVGLTVRF